jgi:DMSO reductase anchor subunit
MKHFHEWPLVLFSALAMAGAGILAAWPLSEATGIAGGTRMNAVVATALLAIAMAVSIAHLGRWHRFPLALGRSGRSPLSTEVLAAAATLASVLPLAFGVGGMAPAWWSGFVAAVSCLFLVSLGLVYRLPASTSWTGLVPIGPLVSGLLFGVLWRLSAVDAWGLRFTWPALLLVGLDAAVLGARARAVAQAAGQPAHPAIHTARHLLLVARFLLFDAGVVLFVQRGAPQAALLAAALGLLLDRYAFYGLAVTRTIESEIDAVEAVLADRSK